MNALVLATLFASFAPESTPPAEGVKPKWRNDTHRWGVEVELIQPFIPTVNIIRARGTRTLWGRSGKLRGDVVAGVYIRPNIRHDVVYRISEYMATVGYRQYFWRGLHLEALVNAGAAWGTNRVDEQYYRTPSLFGEVNAGYRFGFFEPGGFFADRGKKVGFYLALQGGTIFTMGVADIGPRNGKPDVFAQGNLLLGLSF